MVTRPRVVGNIIYFDFRQNAKEQEDEVSLLYENPYDPVYREARGAIKGSICSYIKEDAISTSQEMMLISRDAVGRHFEGYHTDDLDNLACALIRATHKAKLTRIVPEWADSAAGLAKCLEDVLWRKNICSQLFFLDNTLREYVANLALLSENKGIVRPEELELTMYAVLRYEQVREERLIRDQNNNIYDDRLDYLESKGDYATPDSEITGETLLDAMCI